jgi:Ricin-type beta-trefoil lectin domain
MKVTKLFRSRLTQLAAGAVAVTAALSFNVGPAQADAILVLRNYHTGRCVDDSFEAGLRTFSCNGMDYQQWRAHWITGLTATLQNVHTGRCIDWSEDYGLRPFTCNGLNYQHWNLGSGDEIWSNRSPYLNLDDSFEFGLRVFTMNHLDYQHWHWH